MGKMFYFQKKYCLFIIFFSCPSCLSVSLVTLGQFCSSVFNVLFYFILPVLAHRQKGGIILSSIKSCKLLASLNFSHGTSVSTSILSLSKACVSQLCTGHSTGLLPLWLADRHSGGGAEEEPGL